MNELDLITTDELIAELANRHREIIIIRDEVKDAKMDFNRLYVKTQRGKYSREDKPFDLILATEMLVAAQNQLVWDYMKDDDDEEPEEGEEEHDDS